jgi:hypothetical protein
MGLGALLLSLHGCAPKSASTVSPTSSANSLQDCAPLPGNPWIPNISGLSPTNHDESIDVVRSTLPVVYGPIIGLGQPAGGNAEISVRIDMTEDLGPLGSLTLEASAVNMPGGLSGHAIPLLVSLTDGVHGADYIDLARAGSNGDCAASGYFTCDASGNCVNNPSCTVQSPSVYNDRTHWQDHQLPSYGSRSINTFPTCNWTQTTADQPTVCMFNQSLFETSGGQPRLQYGTTYIAKYVLIADSYSDLTDTGMRAGLQVNVVKKTNLNQTPSGAIDVNIVIVGAKNIAASHTDAGQRNLDTVFSAVKNTYSQSNLGLNLGNIQVYEWGCDGEAYSNVTTSELGTMFSQGSSLLPADTEGKAVNVFLVSSITSDNQAFNANLTILGLSGAVGGPVSNGTEASGLAVSTFGSLDQFNSACTADPCPMTAQDSSFYDFSSTVAHEMGHYLGMNHPTESSGTEHDRVYDTPICTNTESVGGDNYITINSCLEDLNLSLVSGSNCQDACTSSIEAALGSNAGYSPSTGLFCAATEECQFNHLMWWTSKNYDQTVGLGDGNIISPNSAAIVRYSPFVY